MIGTFGLIFVRWAAMVREVAEESQSQAIVRFRLTKAEVRWLMQSSWGDVIRLLSGKGDHYLEVEVDPEFLGTLVRNDQVKQGVLA